LDFRPEKDFGYDFAVKHIKKRGADNHLIMDLSPEGADSGDLKEILKVLY
jgi:hypothetical protein